MRMSRAAMRKVAGRTSKITTSWHGAMRPGKRAGINRRLERKVRQHGKAACRRWES